MSRRGRGSTGSGRPSALPGGGYDRAVPASGLPDGQVSVAFHGDDDRRRMFEFSRLPLPGWHGALAAAFAERTGPGGGLRTAEAAGAGWAALGRLVRFLAALPDPPARPGQLTCEHLRAFHDQRARAAPVTALRDLAEARMLLSRAALREQVPAEVLDHLQRRLPAPRQAKAPATDLDAGRPQPGTGTRLTSGYSDGELARLMAALRADAAAIRDRIRGGEDLLRRYQADPLAVEEKDRGVGGMPSRWPRPARFRHRPAPVPIRFRPGGTSWRGGCS